MENPCSIFVGSLSPETTTEMLEEYFSRFGAIESAVVLQDQITHRSRGFGFVNFATAESRTNALQAKNGAHFIGNKQVDCKPAIRRGEMKADQQGLRQGGGAGGGGRFDQSPQYDNQKKVFVGGISNGTSDEDIKSALSKFGTVENVEQKYDKVSQRMRGFGFVEFSNAREAMAAVHTQFVPINGKTVEIKIAENRQAVPYGPSAAGNFGGSFGNNMGMYGPPLNYGSYSTYPSNTSSGYSGGAPTGYMGNNPSYGANTGYSSGGQYQNFTGKEGGNLYGPGSTYSTGSGYGGGSGSGYGGSSGSGYGGGSGYGRGAYNPYGQ